MHFKEKNKIKFYCKIYGATTLLMIFPSDSISLSITSPALRNSAGFLCIPTPAGVPVKITSPGRRVIDLKNYLF